MAAVFVKIAQVVAHSPALFPAQLVRACQNSLAHAATPPAPIQAIERIIAEELGAAVDAIYAEFDAEPMASASIAQVHAATLQSGESCVVKIVRPRARERLAVDLKALSLAARLGDLVLGKDLVLQLVSASLAGCVDELQGAILAECNLELELRNIEQFRTWLASSRSLHRASLAGRVQLPRTYAKASGTRILTMERIHGVPFSQLCSGGADSAAIKNWQPALSSALCVAALSIIDGGSIFHADLHTGNMLAVPGPSGSCSHVAFIDFGCCGQLPAPLRSTLLMQASAFAGGRPNVKQFTEGFQHALRLLPDLGRVEVLDTNALAEDLKPVLAELQRLNPFRGGVNPMDPELHLQLFRLQGVLSRHGVQLPREFTLLIKTGCFAALYFSMLDAEHKKKLLSQLLVTGAAHAASNPKDARQLLSPATLSILLGALGRRERSRLAAAAPWLRGATAACVAASIPALLYYFDSLHATA